MTPALLIPLFYKKFFYFLTGYIVKSMSMCKNPKIFQIRCEFIFLAGLSFISFYECFFKPCQSWNMGSNFVTACHLHFIGIFSFFQNTRAFPIASVAKSVIVSTRWELRTSTIFYKGIHMIQLTVTSSSSFHVC